MVGLIAGLLALAGCQQTAPEPEVTPGSFSLERGSKPPLLEGLSGPPTVAIGIAFPIFITGDAGTADLKEVVFQIWAAGRGNIESGSFPVPKSLQRRLTGKIVINSVSSVGFINSPDFNLLPMEIHIKLRDVTGKLSQPQVHEAQFTELALSQPPASPPQGGDYSARLGTIHLELFPLDFNDRRRSGF
jgi:hypothetical protein